jgi:uncharacterized protein (DUF58 family)
MRRRLLELSDRLRANLALRRISSGIRTLERRAGITRTGEVGIVLAVLLWLMARVFAGVTLYLVAYGALLLIVVSWLTVRRRLPLEGGRTELRARARVGEVLTVGLELRARRRLSTIVLEEALPEKLGDPVRLPVASIAGGEEVTHEYRLACTRRGAYTVGPLVARWGDPFGVCQREMVLAEPFEVLVHPAIENVSDRPLTRQFEDPPIRPPVSKPWPSGLEFYGMREYVRGDDLRRIVWRATARTGKVMVREAEQGITDRITILLDSDRTYHGRETPSESFEAAIRAAASLGVKHLGEGYSVTVEANAGPVTRALRGAGSQIRMLDALARLDMDREPLSTNIMRRVSDPRSDAHNILITPRLKPADAAQLRMLLNRGLSVLVIALMWDDEASETLNTAAALGCQVVELRPGQSVAAAMSIEVGAGQRL